VSGGIFDVDNVERSRMSFAACDDAHTAQIVTAGDHDCVSHFELDGINDFAGGNVHLDRVVGLDQRIRITDGSAVVRHQEGNSLRTHSHLPHAAQLVRRFFWSDAMDSESSFGIIDQSEVFVGSFDSNDIHESSGIRRVSADFSVDFDEPLHKDLLDFISSQGVLESVPQKDDKWQRFAKLVRSAARSRRKDSTEFVQHPVFGGI